MYPLEMPKLNKPAGPYARLAFYGPMCSGKTFCASWLTNNHSYNRIGFADKLKTVSYDLFGVESKDGVGRKLLQEFADDCKKWDADLFTKHFLYKVQKLEETGKGPIVCDDLRFLAEAKILIRNGFTIVRIHADEDIRKDRISKLYPNFDLTTQGHNSEREFSFIDSYIDTSGLPPYIVASNEAGITVSDLSYLVSRFYESDKISVHR